MELTRLLEQREGVITELRKQMHQRDKAMHTQRAQFEDALRNVQVGALFMKNSLSSIVFKACHIPVVEVLSSSKYNDFMILLHTHQ